MRIKTIALLTSIALTGCSSHTSETNVAVPLGFSDFSCKKIESEISAERDSLLKLSFLEGYNDEADDVSSWMKMPSFNTQKTKNKKNITVSQQRIKILANTHKEKNCDKYKISAHPISTSAFFALDSAS